MRSLFILLAAFCLIACSPESLPERERLGQAEITQDALRTSDGEKLAVSQWSAANPKAVIVAVHGYNDYSQSFRLFGEQAKQRGISVIAYDQRGYGRNANLGVWSGHKNLVNDASDMLKAVRKKHPNLPIYLLGSSMGGAVVIEMLHHHAQPDVDDVDIAGVILNAPAAWGGEAADGLKESASKMVLWSLAHTVPDAKLTGESLNIQPTDNIEILKELAADPYVIKASRVDSVYQLVDFMEAAFEHKAVLKRYQTLLLYGEKDDVIPPEPIYHVARLLPESNVRIYPNGYHMLLRDRQRGKVFDDIFNWMQNPEAELK